MSYKLSVVIPTFNAEKFLDRTIDCIKNQTICFENIELILVDDNSKDKTREILKQYSDKYPNVKSYFPEGNSGTPSRGRNIGIEKANSDYIMFLDQDDRYALNMCEVLYEVIEETGSDFVMSNIKYIKNSQFLENNVCIFDDTKYKVIDSKKDKDIFLRNYMWDKIYKIDFLKEFDIKCPEGLFYEDLYFSIQCHLNSDKMVFLENFYGYEYNMRDDTEDLSTSNNLLEIDYIKSIEPYYEICDFFKEKGRQDLLNWLLEEYFVRLIGTFSRLNVDYKTKITFLEELYSLYNYSTFNGNIDELWADIIFQNIKRENFKMAIILSKIINFFVNSYTLRKLYREIYNKEYS